MIQIDTPRALDDGAATRDAAASRHGLLTLIRAALASHAVGRDMEIRDHTDMLCGATVHPSGAVTLNPVAVRRLRAMLDVADPYNSAALRLALRINSAMTVETIDDVLAAARADVDRPPAPARIQRVSA